MKNTTIKLLTIAITATFISCSNQSNIDYKFLDAPKVLTCELKNSKLYNEAIHSFESDIIAFYDKTGNNKAKAYAGFTNNSMNGRIKIEDIATKHSLNIALALKKESDLWNNKAETTLNYSHPLVNCIIDNIKTKYLKQTFKALLKTNSLRKDIILPPLRNVSRSMQTDGSLVAFLAFEYYFPKVWSLKPESIKTPEKVEEKVDFNKTPAAQKTQPEPNNDKQALDPHAGHNH